MIYIKNRLLFVHIPRTGGNSITRTLTRATVCDQSLISVTDATPRPNFLHRHSTYSEIVKFIPEVEDEHVIKFAVDRDPRQIYESFYRLHRMSSRNVGDAQWQESVRLSRSETLNEFIDRLWVPWLDGRTIWEHWTSNDSRFHLVPYLQLQQHWPTICEWAGLDVTIDLPCYDWQLLQLTKEASNV